MLAAEAIEAATRAVAIDFFFMFTSFFQPTPEKKCNAMCERLISSVALEHDLERLEDELNVFTNLAVAADIVVVEAHLPFERNVAAAADLPDAGETRCHGKAHAVPRFVFRHFRGNRRARTHDRHVALENVEELRKFVEAELAQYAAERIDTRVVLHLERLAARLVLAQEFFLAFFGIGVHASELVHRK